MKEFGHFYLDKEKDIVVYLSLDQEQMHFTLRTPNHHSGNLIKNLAKLCDLPLSTDEVGFYIIEGIVPCYIDGANNKLYVFRLGNTKVANIYPDGTIEIKASIPSVSKTLMSQTKNYKLDIQKTIIKTYILKEYKFETDVHTHMNAILSPDVLIALAIMHQLRYPLYYIKKLNLRLSNKQQKGMIKQRKRVEKQFADSPLEGKYLIRKIDDNTFINFADLILNNLENANYNIHKIRASLSILKDGQAVFTNLEKVYLYRYVFTKGIKSTKAIELHSLEKLHDQDIKETIKQIQKDRASKEFKDNTLFQDKLLWIARTYQKQGIHYAEISDTTLVKKYDSVRMLEDVHEVMPKVYKETGVCLRFLAAMRRIPMTLMKSDTTNEEYLKENLQVLKAIAIDPYVVGSDLVGEEINDIKELKPVIQEIVRIAKKIPSFVIRIHAGENDSLKDNVADSIACVKASLSKGQKMPQIRIGHGLYTTNLKSKKGKALIKELKDNHVILEFQITSNVRLNNLNSLDVHPLKQYLKEGILCVQGTDGGAIYGTTCIDEQLSLERLLNLSHEELEKMKKTDTLVYEMGKKAFLSKQKKLNLLRKNKTLEDLYFERIQKSSSMYRTLETKKGYDANKVLQEKIEEFPWDQSPVIIAGGSFNREKRKTKCTPSSKKVIDTLMDTYNPKEVFFVIGHTLSGYEEYLLSHNKKGFKIYCIVPSILTKTQAQRLKKANVGIRVSTESLAMGLYKSFNYEIFERRPSTVFAFDGNSAVLNLVQEAHNGKGKATIFLSDETELLKEKAQSLYGYVEVFHTAEDVLSKL
ncbi:MAG: hypothetical protein IKE51_00330 [Solobacterium sp.]|nr:hypothetical protein [Solobacterium sp.]